MAVDTDVREGSLNVGAAEALFEMTKLGHFATYAPTPDGQRFLVVLPKNAKNSVPLTLEINWTSGLDKN